MELTLIRKYKTDKYTIGKLYIDGEYLCDTMEDRDRGLYQGMNISLLNKLKVQCETAIPYGRYKINMRTVSPKYSGKKQYEFCGGKLPRLENVPGYEGILIHIGNYPDDSCGCILPGENKIKGAVVNSTTYFKKLYGILKDADDEGKDIYITIQP